MSQTPLKAEVDLTVMCKYLIIVSCQLCVCVCVFVVVSIIFQDRLNAKGVCKYLVWAHNLTNIKQKQALSLSFERAKGVYEAKQFE